MSLIVPYLAVGSGDEITIDGVVYKVPLIDSDGHLQVDVLSTAIPSGAATAARQDTMITALQLIDDLRGALAAVATDRLYTNAYAAGASEVKAVRGISSAPSTTRRTIVTPTAGKKIRIIAVQLLNYGATGTSPQVYFGLGVNMAASPGKEVVQAWLDVDTVPNHVVVWPDGAGPVGDVDDVVSLITSADIGSTAVAVIHYREE